MNSLQQKLDLKKRLTMRGYQETVVTDIVENFGLNKPYVLGSCPGSGKTEMAIESMIRLIESGEVNRVLVLAHSTNVLKENFYERLCEYFNEGTDIDVMRGQKSYNYNARIQVMIPQNIGHVIGKFDLIITDEAQHNVLAEDGNYSRIVEMVEPKFQLLLTGTPSKFILENNFATNEGIDLPYHINTVGMDMVGFKHFHNVRFDLIKSAYGFTNEDYNQNKDLYTDTNFSFDETERTVNNVIIGAVRNIALRGGVVLPKDSDFILEGRKLIQAGKFGKTLIMCRSIEQANQISSIISKLFEVKVRVSQSKNDTDSSNLDKFKRNQFDFLCVVNRAREGYDDNKIVNLIDITMTHNIDLIYQMFCRVVRLDKTNPNPKLYIKVTSNAEGMPDYTMNIMTAALMLGATENLSAFNGRNFRGLVMPRIERVDDEDDEEDDDVVVDGVVDVVDTGGNVIRRRRISDLMALDLIQMFTQDEENLISGNDRYAMTTLGESLKLLKGNRFDVDSIEECVEIGKKHQTKSALQWLKNYKSISEQEGIELPATPWTVFNLEGGEKEFSRILGLEKEVYDVDSIKKCIEIGKKHNITSSTNWLKSYKSISEHEGLKLPSQPWKSFSLEGGEKEFSRMLGLEKEVYDVDSIEECIEIGNRHQITSSTKWGDQYKSISEQESLKLPSHPWIVFNLEGGIVEFSRLLGNNHKTYDVDSIEECIEIGKKYDVTSSEVWRKLYKSIGEKEGLKLPSKPWKVFNLEGGAVEFARLLGNNHKIFDVDSIEECIEIGKKHNISSSVAWSKSYKSIGEKEGLKLPATPWKVFNLEGGIVEFSRLLGSNRSVYDVDSIEECIEIGMRNNITSATNWSKSYKSIGEKEGLKLPATPWKVFNLEGGEKEFTKLLKMNLSQEKYRPAYLGKFSEMNKLWNTTNSKNNHKRLNEKPSEWREYHKLYSQLRKSWGDDIPYKVIASEINKRPDWVVGDFGCGENLLSKEIKNKVHAFDHISEVEDVVSCDVTDVPLNNNTLDVVVFSLSLMGTNYKEYFEEAYRVLKQMGLIMIAEPATRWEDREEELKCMLDASGFKVTGDIKHTERFIYVDAIKY